MGDPLSDPRAAALLAADPTVLGALAGAFHRVASQAQTAAASLRGAHDDGSWTGQAADAFRAQLGGLPGDLDKVERSYGDAAAALSGYEAQLAPVRSAFQTLTTQLQGARAGLSTAQGQLGTAQRSLSTASSAPHASSSTPAVVTAHAAVQSASSAVGRMQGELSGLERRGFELLDEFDTIRGHARSSVSNAAGIAPSHSWLSGALHAIGNFMSGAGHVLLNIGKGVLSAAEHLPSDIVTVIEHPTDLKDWGKLGEDVGTVAGAVALVAAVVICPADALGLEAVVEVAETAGGVAETAGLSSGIAKTAADSGLVLEGKGSIGEVGFDALGLALGKVEPGVGSAETDVEHLAGKSGALEQYGLSRATGASHQQAYAALTDEQRSLITTSARKLSDPGRLHYMRSSTLEQLDGAKTHLYRIKLVNEGGHYVIEKGTDAIKKVVLPEPAGCGTEAP